MARTLAHRSLKVALAALAVAAASCGGGDDSAATAPDQQASLAATAVRVVVAGDSLADVGTFGLKATVQNAADPAAGYPIYPEIVARDLGAGRLCNAFSSTDGDTFTSNAGCTDFAVAGALVRNPATRGGAGTPFSLEFQLASALAANGGAWRAGDLIVVDGGANDAALLAEAYRGALEGGARDAAIFLAFLAQQLDGATMARALARPDGRSVAANLYMQRLAQTAWATVKAHTVDHGATRVVLVNLPDITLTPRFRGIAAQIQASQGPAKAAAFQAALRHWVVSFNTELAAQVAGDPRVVVAPCFDDFTALTTTPSAFGLTNVIDASCPPTGGFAACTDAAMDAAPPPGLGPGWWRTWIYADNFHPTPAGHALLAATIERALARADWR